jgi:hypothetical protein
MTWHSVTVRPADLADALATIQRVHGTITSYKPGPDAVLLSWTTTSEA